jgi:Ca2+/H+ antiporter
MELVAGKLATAVAFKAAATEAEAPQTARVVVVVVEAVAVLPVADEAASEAHAEAAVVGDPSGAVKVLPQRQQEASHKSCLTAPPHPHRL